MSKESEVEYERQESSVSLVKNSKGVNIGVKVYNENPAMAQKQAETVFNDLTKKYPQVDK